ncbi:MAG TPA: cation diffusion facilitator family transporter, partial [Candidatus Blautia stercoravium]|nr:cation diffusion facilitator family transporter [Candidatus Blautia stercoravium]
IILFLAKLVAGIMTGAISIMADAFNNLSDAGSSIVTLIGFKLAGKPADKEHPFGHGRIEYLAGIFISAAILLVGWQLGTTSIQKIIHPEELNYSAVSVLILVGSVLMKFWMASYNRYLGNKIQSATMKATSMDSLSDCIATSAVILSIVISYFTHLKVDGIAGLIVSIFIFIAGINSMKDTIQPLLGQAPDPEFVKAIEKVVMSHDVIIGIHDMIVHNYGPGRIMVSLHAEIPVNMDIMEAHDVIDDIEMDIKEEFQCDITIHMDPVILDDQETNEMRETVKKIVKNVESDLTMHDFRMTNGPLRTNLIFDVVVPFESKKTDIEIKKEIAEQVKQIEGNYYARVQIDKG